ncbi:hypothetical protein SPBR_01876 [Sporothrix brasiliensis 5110]|uniref:Uncharacterized protein n=1 Tax=Sporothrix brasiliensis 5110 TaxID=1398154 RepID=A0A0C2EXU0_9PEZI|nr:uncharacterized protein SPBR_01876 [Sporothrix brasiliensis 5110]KIH91489.1 hypothetical protein SPBR_01876 [Sporothrix brasiliensis 5110]
MPPQPGPLKPPWPDANPDAGPQRRKIYTSEKGLIENAITMARIDLPYKLPFPSPGKKKHTGDPILSIAVPRPPDFRRDFTNLGPDVVAPWRKGGVFKLVSEKEIMAAGTSVDKKFTKSYGVRIRYSHQHSLHPWSANNLAASPGIEDALGASDGQGVSAAPSGWPVGFPHPFSEMARRRYALKNRSDPLWWFAIVFAAEGQLPNSNLVRNKMRYKLQSAVEAALRQRGYAANGVRLDGSAGANAKYSQLYGSIRADGPLVQMLTAPYDELVGFLAQAIIVVESLLGGRKQTKLEPVRSEPEGRGTSNDAGYNTGKIIKGAQETKQYKGKKSKDRFHLLLDPALF